MVLFSMAIGLAGGPDLSAESFKCSNQKSKFTPKAATLTSEIFRRADLLGTKHPKCKNWMVPAKNE